LHPEAILTTLSAVPHAARPGRHNVTEMIATATVPGVRCSPQCVLSVARIVKCHSSPAKADRYIVAIATMPLKRIDSASWNPSYFLYGEKLYA